MKMFAKYVFIIAIGTGLTSSAVLAEGPGYVIITTTSIVQQSTQLTNYVAHKRAMGFEVTVVSNTATTLGGWGGGIGNAAAENIRAWLQGHRTNAQAEIVIDYALLLGNPNPTNGDVPMKLCYPRSTNEDVPTDFYYADLVGNWDINSNGFYGEYADYTNTCGPNRHYEVAVGRIPFYGSIQDLDGIQRKIIQYEADSLTNSSWRKDALLLMPNQDYSTWGYSVGPIAESQVFTPEGWTYTSLYNFFNESATLGAWTNRPHGVVMSWGHGNNDDPIGTVSCGYDGLLYLVCYLSLAVVNELDDSRPAHVFLCGCQQAHPETTNNLAYALLKRGAITAIGATRESYCINNTFAQYEAIWFAHGQNPRIMHDYVQCLVRDGMPSGNALYSLKDEYAPSSDYGLNTWANYLDYNLYGCPAVSVLCPFSGASWSF